MPAERTNENMVFTAGEKTSCRVLFCRTRTALRDGIPGRGARRADLAVVGPNQSAPKPPYVPLRIEDLSGENGQPWTSFAASEKTIWR